MSKTGKNNNGSKNKKIWTVVAAIAVVVVLLAAVALFYPGGITGLFASLDDASMVAGPTEEAGVEIVTPPVITSTKKETAKPVVPEETEDPEATAVTPDENGYYYDKAGVALYIHTYGKLPPNYITKLEARELGWRGGSVEKYAPGKVIGGDVFGNNEGLLPKNVTYTECDIDTRNSDRGAKRIVFGSDGSIYYTDDHYESFTRLY